MFCTATGTCLRIAAPVFEVGRLLGADAFLAGEVLSYDVEFHDNTTHATRRRKITSSYTGEDGKEHEKSEWRTEHFDVYTAEKSGSVRISYRLVDPATGLVLTSGVHEASYSKTDSV